MLINLQSNRVKKSTNHLGMQTNILQEQIKQVLVCPQLKNRVALGSTEDDQWVEIKLITPFKYPVVNPQCLAEVSSIFRINEQWPRVLPALYLSSIHIPSQAQFINIMEEIQWPDSKVKTIEDILVFLVEEIDKYGLKEWIRRAYGECRQNYKQDENQKAEVNLINYNKIAKCNNNKNYKQNLNINHNQFLPERSISPCSGIRARVEQKDNKINQCPKIKQDFKNDRNQLKKQINSSNNSQSNNIDNSKQLSYSCQDSSFCQDQNNQQQRKVLSVNCYQLQQNKQYLRQKTYDEDQIDTNKSENNPNNYVPLQKHEQPKNNRYNNNIINDYKDKDKQSIFTSPFSCFKPIKSAQITEKHEKWNNNLKVKEKLESSRVKEQAEANNKGFMPYRPLVSSNACSGFQLYSGAPNNYHSSFLSNQSAYGFSLSGNCKLEDDLKQQIINHNPLEINYLNQCSKHPKPMNKNANLPKFLIRIFIKYVDKYKTMYVKRQYDKLVSECKKMKEWKKNDRRQHAFGLKHLKIFFQDYIQGFPSPVLNRRVISRIIDNYLLQFPRAIGWGIQLPAEYIRFDVAMQCWQGESSRSEGVILIIEGPIYRQ